MKSYILQEQVAYYQYLDLYETNDLRLIKEALKVFKQKYPDKKYRIVLWRL